MFRDRRLTMLCIKPVKQELAKEGILPFSRFWSSTWPVNAPTGQRLTFFLSLAPSRKLGRGC